MNEGTPTKRYYVQLPGEAEFWDEDRFNRNKEALFNDNKDARAFEMSPLTDDMQIADTDTFAVRLPNYQEAEVWDGAKLARNREQLLKDYPDAEIYRTAPVNYYGDQLREYQERVAAIDKELAGLPQEPATTITGDPRAMTGSINQMQAQMEEERANPELSRTRALKREREELNRKWEENPAWQQYKATFSDDIDAEQAKLSQMREDLRNKTPEAAKTQGIMLQNPVAGSVARVLADPEYDKNMGALESASWMLDEAKRIANAPSRYGGDEKGAMSDFWNAVKQNGAYAINETNLIDAGFDMRLVSALKKVQEQSGKNTDIAAFANSEALDKATYLNEGEKEMVKAFTKLGEANNAFSDRISKSYQAGESFVKSLGFMMDFATFGGAGEAVGKAVAKKALNAAGHNAVARLGAETLEGLVKATVMTPMMPSSYANFMDNILQMDDAGAVDLSGKAMAKAGIDALIETVSETIGAKPLEAAGIAIKAGVPQLATGKLADWGRAMRKSPWGASMKQAGYNGFFEEMFEEWTGNALRVATTVDPHAFDNFWEQQLVTAGSFAPLQLLGLPMTAVQYKAASNSLENSRKSIEAAIGTVQDQDVRERLGIMLNATDKMETPEDLAQVAGKIYRGIVENGGDAKAAAAATMRFTQDAARYKVMTGMFDEQKEEQRAAQMTAMDEEMRTEEWRHAGKNDAGFVRTVTDADGNEMFVLGELDGDMSLVDREGKLHYMKTATLEQGVADGTMKDSGEQYLWDYLDKQEEVTRKADEQVRMQNEAKQAQRDLTQLLQPQTRVKLPGGGEGSVVTTDSGRVIVQKDDGTSQDYEPQELANLNGIRLIPETDEERDAKAVALEEKREKTRQDLTGKRGAKVEILGQQYTLTGVTRNRDREDKPFTAYVKDANGQNHSIELSDEETDEMMVSMQEMPVEQPVVVDDGIPRDKQGNPIPMRTNTVTNEQEIDWDALWEQSPETWVERNDANPDAIISSDDKIASKLAEKSEALATVDATRQELARQGGQQSQIDQLNEQRKELAKDVARIQALAQSRVAVEQAVANVAAAEAPVQEAQPAAQQAPVAYEQGTPQATYSDIYGNEAFETAEEADGFVQGRIATATAEVQKAQKAYDKVQADNKAGKYASPAEFAQAKAQAQQSLAEAQSNLDHWNGVKAIADNAVAEVEAERQRIAEELQAERQRVEAKAAAMRQYMDTIQSEGYEATVVTRDNILETMRKDGCREEDIESVRRELQRSKERGYALRGIRVNGNIYMLADDILNEESARTTYIHERQHGITRKRGYARIVQMMNIPYREMEQIVEHLCGTTAYNGSSAGALAEEMLSMAMEVAYSVPQEEVENALKAKGVTNRNFINFVKTIDDEQRNDRHLRNARRDTLRPVNAERGGRQDGRDRQPLPDRDMEREGSRPGRDSGEGAEGEQGAVLSRTGQAEREQRELTDKITAAMGGETEDGTPVMFSRSSIFEGAGFTAAQVDDAGNKTPLSDSEGNVIVKMGDKVFSAKNPVTIDDLKANGRSSLNIMLSIAEEKGTIDGDRADIIRGKFADILNLFLREGAAEKGGWENLNKKWLWLGDTVFRTVATNGDKQYSYSMDITRVCKKNEAVIRAISALQKRQGYGATPAQIMDIYQKTLNRGYQVPCPVCYVFSRYLRNGKYASAAINGMLKYGEHLPNGKDPWTAERWDEEVKDLDRRYKEAKTSLDKANADVERIFEAIDRRAVKLLDKNTSAAEKKKLRAEIEQLDAQYRAAINLTNQVSLKNWINTFAIQSVDGEVSLRDDARMPEDMKDFADNALDLRKVGETMRKYPAIQRLRRSGGSAAGKEITFESNNELGEIISGVGTGDPSESVNWFQIASQATTDEEFDAAMAKAREAFDRAYKYAQRQTLRGGQRMWSWSDNIESLSPDVAVNLMQMELLGGALQSYSKQLEGIAMVAAMDGYVNGSLMAKDDGVREVSDDMLEEKDGMFLLKEPITETIDENTTEGKVQRTRVLAAAGSPALEIDGKKYVLIFDDIIGVDPHGRDKDGKHKMGLFDLNKQYSRAGNILVGMNDKHVRTAMADGRIYFIIPWHSSGQSVHILNSMLGYLGSKLGIKATDYTAMQEEKSYDKKKDSKTKKEYYPTIPQKVIEIWESHKNETDFASGIGPIESGHDGQISESQFRYRELRSKIFDGTLSDDELRQVQADAFLHQVYEEVQAHGGTMTATDNGYIYPYEYWNKEGRIENADENAARYIEYCRRLGVCPKFSGKWGKNGAWSDEGNFIDDKGYWKLLIDRRMYDVDGYYQDLTPTNSAGFEADMVDPAQTEKKYVSTTVADDSATDNIVDDVQKVEDERAALAGKGSYTIDYGLSLEEAQQEYDDSRSGIKFSRTAEPQAVDKTLAFINGEEEQPRFSRVTPEQDAEYLDAVKAGDMEKAQRMVKEAAAIAMPETKALGKDGLPAILHHGTHTYGFTVFARPGENLQGLIWMTDDMRYASVYQYNNEESGVYNLFADLKNPLELGYIEDVVGSDAWNAIAAKLNLTPEGLFDAITKGKQGTYEQSLKQMDYIYDFTRQDGFVNLLREKGYDGVIALEDGVNKIPTVGVVNPNQIKSADPVTYDNDGNVIPLSERFNPDNDDIRFSRANDNQRIFVSNAEAAVDAIPMAKATPQQWLKMIESKGGLKAGEDKWIGLSDWLKEQDAKTLTKQDVQDYIAQHQIQIEEVHYGDSLQDEIRNTIGRGRVLSELQEEIDELKESDDYQTIGDAWLRDEWLRDEMKERYGDDFELGYDIDEGQISYQIDPYIDREYREAYDGPVRPINNVRAGYTTEGLDNKAEIALTVPTIEPYNADDKIHFGDAGEGRAIAWIRFGDAETFSERGKLLDKVGAARHAVQTSIPGMGNAKAELEAAERELEEYDKAHPKESNKKRVLFIDEIQSKRHQDARERGGYAPEKGAITAKSEEIVELQEQIDQKITDIGNSRSIKEAMEHNAIYKELAEKMDRVQEEYHNLRSREDSPASAPFERNWHELAMKRMLRLAAEEGYDYVAWTTGDQQAERYNMGGVIDSIYIFAIREDGSRSLEIKTEGAEVFNFEVDANGVITEQDGPFHENVEGKKITDVFGKGLADTIMGAKEEETIEGEGLRVGGEGMKGFYDQMLPRFMDKYGKKWGVKTEDMELPNLDNGITAHAIPVTDEMKESVMEGQLMFSKTAESPVAYDESANAVEDAIKEAFDILGISNNALLEEPQHYRDQNDGVRTALMDAVGMETLSDILGRDNTRNLMLNVYRDLPDDLRKAVAEDAVRNRGANVAEAMQNLASEAAVREARGENTEDYDTMWESVRANLQDALADIGINIPLSLRDVKWMMAQPAFKGHESDPLLEAGRQVVALAYGKHRSQQRYKDDGIAFSRKRDADNTENVIAADAYNRAANDVVNRLKESFVDQYQSVQKFVEAIENETGQKAKPFEDIRLALNQMSSKALAAMNNWIRKYNIPMWDAIKAVMKAGDYELHDVERYVMLKHGLERNEVFAKRDAKEYYQKKYDKAVADIKASKDLDAAAKANELEHEKRNLERRLQRVDAGTDRKYLEFRQNDYGGLTGLYSDYGEGFEGKRRDETQEEYNRRAAAARKPKYTKEVDTGEVDQYGNPIMKTVVDMEAMEDAARAEVAIFEKYSEGTTDELWKRINAATKATLREQYNANIISRKQYESVKDMFQYYVPLRGFADATAEDFYDYYTSDQRSNFTPPMLKAEGRKSKAESPFGYIAAAESSGIAQNTKNEAKLTLYYFVSNRQGNSLVSVSDVWYEKTGEKDEQGRDIFAPAYPPFNEEMGGEEAKRKFEDWQKLMEEKAANGLAYRGSQKLTLPGVIHMNKRHDTEHVVNFKLGGKDMMMYINGNPRVAQAINNELNYNAEKNVIIDTMNQVLRVMSALNTQLNPEFWISNFQRDVLFAIMGTSVKEDKEYNKAFRKNLAAARKVVKMKKAYDNGTLGDSHDEQLYREFADNGGVTGYTVVYNNEYWEDKLKEYSGEKRNVVARMLDSMQAITDFGEAIEQLTRFAAFKTSREAGRDIKEAVRDAKELTVNFNRKGSGKAISLEEASRLTYKGRPLSKWAQVAVSVFSNLSPYGRRLVMFFNAAIQGLNAMAKLYKADLGKAMAWSGAYVALGMMNAVLHSMLDGDDDDDYLDIPDWERRNNAMLGYGGVYLKWALPQEARGFYAMGDAFVNHALGREPHKNLAGEILESVSDVMPVDVSSGFYGLAPSVTTPIVDIVRNKNFMGSRVYNEQKYLSDEDKKNIPEYRSALPNTSRVWTGLSKGLNWLSGGDEYSAGVVNVNPNIMEHLFEGYTGGLGTTVGKSAQFFEDIIGGDLVVRDTPFLRRILSVNDERYRNAHTTELYYYYEGIAEDTKRQIKEATKKGDDAKLDRLYDSKEYEILNIYEGYRKEIKWYNDELKATDDTDERRSLMKEQDAVRKEMLMEISNLKDND